MKTARTVVPSRTALLAVWIAVAVLLSTLLAVARLALTVGDDTDPGRQRPGILDLGPLPEPVPPVDGLVLAEEAPAVVFFAAGERVGELCRALREEDDLDGERVVLVAEPVPTICAEGVRVSRADLGEAALAFGLPATRGGVPPAGYAIVDGRGRIRYRTLDPVARELLDEVATMLAAVS